MQDISFLRVAIKNLKRKTFRTVVLIFAIGLLVSLPVLFQTDNTTAVSEQKVLKCLDIVGLKDKVLAYPSQLSGGQQRRVAIARDLINDPEIILADEPTGDLDKETEAEIMELFYKINREKETTIILITHNLELAKKAKTQLCMTQVNLQISPDPIVT